MNWKDFLYFQRGEKTAVILLLILIVFALVANALVRFKDSSDVVLSQNDSLAHQFERFRQSLKEQTPTSLGEEYESETSRYYSERKVFTKENTPHQGKKQYSDGAHFSTTEKFAVGETISLNETDTAQWKKIPGIGSSYAARIVKYRNLLGGFASVKQLLEVYGVDRDMFEKIVPFIAEDNRFNRLNVNKLEFKELLQHPYLNYKQVKVITDLRRKKGYVESIRELEMFSEFSLEDIERLKPYLTFQ